MGNCLDVPPPPPKRRHANQAKINLILEKQLSAAAGPAMSVPGVYSTYKPYPVFVGAQPTVPVNPYISDPYSYPIEGFAVDPVSEEPYLYPMDGSTFPYYSNPTYHKEGNNGIHEYHIQKESEHTNHLHVWRQLHNGKTPHRTSSKQTKNAHLTSTIISTSSDPQDDVIRKGYEIIVSNNKSWPENGALPTITSGSIKLSTSTEKTKTLANSTTATKSTNGGSFKVGDPNLNQDIVVQTLVTSAPVATRGSTYITYIQEEPPSPEPLVSETDNLENKLPEQQSDENVALRAGLAEVPHQIGTHEDKVSVLLIDRPSMSSHVVTKTVSDFVSSDWLKKVSFRNRQSAPVHDVVLCCDPADVHVTKNVKRELQSEGLTVAISDASGGKAGDECLDWSAFSQAVIHAKIMVVILSRHSVKNKHVRDQVVLAHVTETSLYPVALAQSQDILATMDMSLKLQLAGYTWTELHEGGNHEENMEFMIRDVKEGLAVSKNYDIVDEEYGEVSSWAQRKNRVFKRRNLRRLVSIGSRLTADRYWGKFYVNGVYSIPWERFCKDLCREYMELLRSIVPVSCIPRLMETLKREFGAGKDGLVHKAQFVEFCTELSTDHDVWERIRSVARETQAILDVFDAGSTVRMAAIENIDKFSSQNVVLAARDLLADSDPIIRATVTMTLSRCSLARDPATLTSLIRMLDDQDNRVREAGCLAMAHIRDGRAVDKLLLLWRCDVSTHVRDSAAAALREIGGNDIIKVMSSTNGTSE